MNEEMIKTIKEQVLAAAAQASEIFAQLPIIDGERFMLPLEGRDLNAVYYRCGKEKAPLMIALYGGGFVNGSCALLGGLWKRVGKELGHHVAVIDYRKAPNYFWRESMEDAFDTAVYMKERAEEFDIDADAISIIGCSAGASIAASACLYANQKKTFQFKNQILVYPLLDLVTPTEEKTPGSMDNTFLQIVNDFHCEDPEERKLAFVSPVFATEEELKGLPNTIIVTAGHDNLRGDSEKYVKLLQAAKIPVAMKEWSDMPHGYFEAGFDELPDEMLLSLGQELFDKARSGEVRKPSEETIDFIKGCMI